MNYDGPDTTAPAPISDLKPVTTPAVKAPSRPGRCALCPQGKTLVRGDGPTPCDILFITEHPGPVENKRGYPLSGPTGQEFDQHYLPLCGKMRPEIRVTNVVKCQPVYKKLELSNPKHVKLIETCGMHHLPFELEECWPKMVVLMGAVACHMFKAVTTDTEIDAEFVRPLDLELEHGMLIPQTEFASLRQVYWTGPAFLTYHPARGLHSTADMIPLRADFETLKRVFKGTSTAPVDEYSNPDYRELRSLDDLYSVTYDLRDTEDIGADTEWDEASPAKDPLCFSFSGRPGTGYVIKVDNRELIHAWGQWITRRLPSLQGRRLIIFHNSLVDLETFRRMGVNIERFTDTMQIAYNLQNQPQKLKHLAYRLCGMVMEDYEDLCDPYVLSAAVEWLTAVAASKWPGQSLRKRQQPIHKRATRILADMLKRPSTNPIDRWDLIPEEERVTVTSHIGDIPRRSLTLVPWPLVIPYSGRDSDATLRIWPHMKHQSSQLRKGMQL